MLDRPDLLAGVDQAVELGLQVRRRILDDVRRMVDHATGLDRLDGVLGLLEPDAVHFAVALDRRDLLAGTQGRVELGVVDEGHRGAVADRRGGRGGPGGGGLGELVASRVDRPACDQRAAAVALLIQADRADDVAHAHEGLDVGVQHRGIVPPRRRVTTAVVATLAVRAPRRRAAPARSRSTDAGHAGPAGARRGAPGSAGPPRTG